MSDPLEIPDKLLFRIGEVCDLLQLRPHVLRYWETEFPTIRPEKSRTNQRLYRRKDVELLAEVKRLLYEEGFTIAGARKQLRRGRRPPPPPPNATETSATATPYPESQDAQAGLQSPATASIRGAAQAPEAGPPAPGAAVPIDDAAAAQAAAAVADLGARCAALEQELAAERARGQALRARVRAELEAIAALATPPPDPDGA